MRGNGPKTTEMGRVSLCGVIACCACVVIMAAVLLAVFAPCGCGDRPAARKSNCQSNLKQIGSAFKMYLGDWDDTYPTNRPRLTNGKFGPISSHIELTPVSKLTPPNKPHNLCWVEALYPYIEMPSEDSNGAWECRSASRQRYPKGSSTAYTTYVMNRNLVERSDRMIGDPSHLLVVREMDRLVNAELRPRNDSCGKPDAPPESPFLTNRDFRIGRTEPNLHANGSHILLADTHVMHVVSSDVPTKRGTTTVKCWDAKNEQWRVVLPEAYGVRKIAITP